MACSISFQTLLLSSKVRSSPASSFPPSTPVFFLENNYRNESFAKIRSGKRRFCRKCKAMVQQTLQGSSAAYAKEMERLSAKESLLLAFRDAGGFGALVTGKTTDMQRIDVNERIVGLERLNPTPRPTTSPYLEGRWNFEWFGSGSLGLFAARFLSERFPPELVNLLKLDVVIKDGYAKVAASLKLLNSIESTFIISSKLSVEGPLRMKEEYIEGLLESPKVNEESLPQQLRGALNQAATTVDQLPVPIMDVLAGGMKIARDTAGVPEVLTRLDPGRRP
ncbi:hypothetical protein DH2020_039389 [Rehmannia glutinosa]|uniref:Plastid lipid-associated protein/fibrillin conserved domain-containing protein n=1 Tax=Rehmannia glutinosa TaxID=99300 RepID=A0ABR0UYN5_REHGL